MIKPKKESIPKILKIKELRDGESKLSFRAIARALKIDLKEVHRWYMYDVKKLSTYLEK